MSTASELTTTSYAILGLLATRPFTPYEIAKQMDRALGRFWPRARSKIYEEPKKLVAHGLARATPRATGGRRRTVYTITAKGKRALAEWVREPGECAWLEFEPLIKVFYAEHGSKADLLATLRAVREWSDRETTASVNIPEAYLHGDGPFPERLPWLILVGQFLDDYLAFIARWADWAEQTVAAWPDDLAGAPPDLRALEGQARRAQDVIALRSRAGGDLA